MKIITKGTVKFGGKWHPPDSEIEVSEEVALELIADGAAEILEEATPPVDPPEGSSEGDKDPNNENPTSNDGAGEPTSEEVGGEDVIVQVVRKVLAQAESDPDLLTKDDGRPKVGAVEALLGRKPTVEEIQEALEAIQAEERG